MTYRAPKTIAARRWNTSCSTMPPDTTTAVKNMRKMVAEDKVDISWLHGDAHSAGHGGCGKWKPRPRMIAMKLPPAALSKPMDDKRHWVF